MIRSLVVLVLLTLLYGQLPAQWVQGGIFSVFNHFQAAAFQSPDTGVFVYGTDNPTSGEGGIIATFDGDVGGGFYLWYASPLNMEDVDVRWSGGFPYYMAAGSRQNSTSVILKPYSLFENPLQFDSVHTGSNRYYRAIRMRSDLVAFAAGGNGAGNGVIDMSVDTGATWNNIAVFAGQPVSRLHFVNDQLAFASTGGYRRTNNNEVMLPDSGAIYRSSNGGLDWVQVHSDPFVGFSDVAFSSPTNGVATRNDGVIMRTTNGGDSWSPSTVEMVEAMVMTSVTFRQDGVGFASAYRTNGTGGYILISTDGGATWSLNFSTALLNHSRRIYDLYFHNLEKGYASTHIRPLKTVGVITSLEERDPVELYLYPNPANGQAFLTTAEAGPQNVELLDITGRSLWAIQSADDPVSIPLMDVAPGRYIVDVRTSASRASIVLVVQ